MEMNLEYTIDKVNGDLAFNEEHHKYWNLKNKDAVYTSITTLIGKYHEKFDEEYWSRKKAMDALLEDDKEELSRFRSMVKGAKKWNSKFNDAFGIDEPTLEEARLAIIAEWRRINLESTDFGTAYHLKEELRWYDHGAKLVNETLRLQGDYECIKHNFDLDREKAVMPEFLIYYSCPDGILHLAGQVDLLIKDGNDIYILDYKTNKDGIKKTAFFDQATKRSKTMNYPIHNLLDTTYNHYNLQLSLYAWMLKKMRPEFNIKLLRLIHVDRQEKKTFFDVEFLDKECVRLLKNYKRTLMTKAVYENIDFKP